VAGLETLRASAISLNTEAHALATRVRGHVAESARAALVQLTAVVQELTPQNNDLVLCPAAERDPSQLTEQIWSQPKKFEGIWLRIKPLDKAVSRVDALAGPLGAEWQADATELATARQTLQKAQQWATAVCILNIIMNKSRLLGIGPAANAAATAKSITDMVGFLKARGCKEKVPAHLWQELMELVAAKNLDCGAAAGP
jgi:hypothetical protein